MPRMKTSSRSISDHRLARLIRWGEAVLAWLAAILITDAQPKRRHGARCAMLDLMPRFIECLLVLRASNLVFPRPFARRTTRPLHAPAGFARRAPTRTQTLRAAIGLAMRRRLRPRDLCARFAVWFEALRNLDAFAAPLVRRARRRLTRLSALIPVRPPHVTARSIAPAVAPQPADTS
jgi:hypothetical protein